MQMLEASVNENYLSYFSTKTVLKRNVSMRLQGVYLNSKAEFNGDQEKRIHSLCEGWIEASVPRNHYLYILPRTS